MSVTLLYLTYNRLEFTRASVGALLANTDWNLVDRLIFYDDSSTDGTCELIESKRGLFPLTAELVIRSWRSPVAVMCDVIERRLNRDTILAKIDNDTMLPSGWLSECLDVMQDHPDLDLLGIESIYPVQSRMDHRPIEAASFIGGIGLMRTRAFESLPVPYGRFGFTGWQEGNPQVTKAWLNPSLPVCLLDRMPIEPWCSLSAEYVAKGWQRPWSPYSLDQAVLWEWFT